MRIVFMGSPDYAVKILDELNKRYDIVALYTQPDKPVGRKKVLTPTPVKKYALENSLEVFTPSSLRDDEIIAGLKPDFIVVAAYGLLLPEKILNIAPCINLHASLLPKYRGASPIQSAILNGDEYTGVTAMLMDVGLDTGDILTWDYTEVGRKTSIDLFNELAVIAAKQTPFVIDNFSKIKPLKQIDAFASYSPKIKKQDGYVTFESALIIDRKYRAFQPWPGIYCDAFKINEMELVDTDSVNKAGEILEINDGVVVGCAKGKIKLLKIQVPGKKEVKAIDYVNGKRLKAGDNII
ncbi:methionyl-tRNA formyltransferase [Nautilia profundicola AmH]|uniref:Methionyl-tRNA formyltransferase n=1 Tax=Nautilia profundicola (strain ATCC BAA-1463 / DSM 18972 / AmH) TaxID=598659 RepID=B9L7X8_NAUPA|nr:methionyl-tRNA formyltransferase [Nautilia profundicola]ACM92529.1 methionyl-tRNA formyltransferase [Nautilia profundicola AmH]